MTTQPLPRRIEHQLTDKGLVPVYTSGLVEQPWAEYSEQDHAVWALLLERQKVLLTGRACGAFCMALDTLNLTSEKIPRFQDLNELLARTTGWKLVGVEGLLPDQAFFSLLAQRQFPVTWWIRSMEQLDYLSEPDLFHDLFGHVPMLMNPEFANYMQAYGEAGLWAHAEGAGALAMLARLYWYTVEFGLIQEAEGLRIYGAGILSSKGESVHCLESAQPHRIRFDMGRVMRTQYRIDIYQQTYFVIDNFRQLMDIPLAQLDGVYGQLECSDEFGPEQRVDADVAA